MLPQKKTVLSYSERNEKSEKLYDLAYVMFYADDYAEVPKDAAEIYQTINTPAFQEKRRGTYWLYHCLMFVEMIYQSVPVRIISRDTEKMPWSQSGAKRAGRVLGQYTGRTEFLRIAGRQDNL